MLTNHCISFGSVGNATRDIGQHLRNQVKRLKDYLFLTGSEEKKGTSVSQVNLRDLFFSQAWHESSNYQCTLSWKCYLPVAFLKGKSLLTVVSGHLWKGWTNDRFLLYKTFLCRRLTDRFDLRLVPGSVDDPSERECDSCGGKWKNTSNIDTVKDMKLSQQ